MISKLLRKHTKIPHNLQWYLKESDPSSVSTLGVVTFSGSSICTSISERPRDTCLQNDFMLLKYRADLFYSLKNFVSAAPLFEKVLELLPPLNAMVKREVNDSLARCYSQLGKHGQAKERAMQLVRRLTIVHYVVVCIQLSEDDEYHLGAR